jgi:hypothetical protein
VQNEGELKIDFNNSEMRVTRCAIATSLLQRRQRRDEIERESESERIASKPREMTAIFINDKRLLECGTLVERAGES